MSSTITLPQSMQPPSPPPNALDTTPGANPNESVAYYQLSSGHVASLPQSSVPLLLKQDPNAKAIPAPGDGQVLVQLASGHAATLPSSSLAALREQDPDFKYVAGDTSALKTMEMTPGFTFKGAFAGPTTAIGAPATPAQQEEASGFNDIVHGSVRQGAGKIWDAEKPHVIQGSLLEKAIQKIDPDFQGGATPTQVAANEQTYPAVDAAQYIDKQQHPVAKALAETAQSFTTPQNVAILTSTGGLGLVDSPLALGMASKLISGGFSAQAIADAYKNFEGFRQAYDSGDTSEALYFLTHAITSGVLTAIAAKDAAEAAPAVKDTIARVNPFRARANAAATAAASINPVDTAVESTLAPAVNKAGIPAGSPATEPPSDASIQPNLQGGICNTVNQAAKTHGFDEIPATTPIRDVPKALGDQAYARSKATFDAAQQATGIDFTALKQAIFKIDDQISDAAIADPERAGQLLQQKIAYEQQAEAGMKAAAAKGVDVSQARSDWNLQLRADELSKHLRNSAEGPLSNPTVNPSKLAPRLQKMNEAEVGEQTPKLSQLLGKDAANQLISHAENAREQMDVIKDFESVSSTDAVALNEMAKAQATTAPSGKVGIDWGDVLQKFDEMPNEEQAARFTRPNAVRALLINLAKRQAGWAVAKKIAIGLGATAGASAVGREVWDTLR